MLSIGGALVTFRLIHLGQVVCVVRDIVAIIAIVLIVSIVQGLLLGSRMSDGCGILSFSHLSRLVVRIKAAVYQCAAGFGSENLF